MGVAGPLEDATILRPDDSLPPLEDRPFILAGGMQAYHRDEPDVPVWTKAHIKAYPLTNGRLEPDTPPATLVDVLRPPPEVGVRPHVFEFEWQYEWGL